MVEMYRCYGEYMDFAPKGVREGWVTTDDYWALQEKLNALIAAVRHMQACAERDRWKLRTNSAFLALLAALPAPE